MEGFGPKALVAADGVGVVLGARPSAGGGSRRATVRDRAEEAGPDAALR